jgi:hypothetical protein
VGSDGTVCCFYGQLGGDLSGFVGPEGGVVKCGHIHGRAISTRFVISLAMCVLLIVLTIWIVLQYIRHHTSDLGISEPLHGVSGHYFDCFLFLRKARVESV